MLIQVELYEVYTECYNVIARSNGVSRRQYITEFLINSADKVPGLVDKVKKEMSMGIQQEADIEMYAPKSSEPPIPLRRYRFTRRDTGDMIEGEGTAAGSALAQATGRKWTQEEFIKEFLDPEQI